ncbi:MAG TPA: DegT/DnrJ/EryC1/StrS family aminotransferase [Candidatus Desulfofervidus auxilii]|uniref:DegT/DnrJ/EryC1/StrS family aminotransferase n=1 Tax=Desulfofervidus auxilii TaxID=1621989 RepID=A0A7C0YAV2_DESA2|nr:DegT/DnrJ/EryC1/StrS family aminotransferase [Candidatus Desulfofervidus auxilii]
MEYRIPLFYPYYNGKKIIEALKKVFPEDGSNKWIAEGEKVKEFEEAWAKKQNEKYCIATNSGTSALVLAYRLAGIKPGDEVIGPVLTCSATYHSLMQLGGKPVFADIDPETLCINPDDIEHRITEKTKAIVVVHFGGYPCDMEKIMPIAKKYGLKIIEDSCQYYGKRIYPEGDYRCYSFQAIKFFTTSDGGMLCVNNEEDYERARRLRWFDIPREYKAKIGWKQFKDWEYREMTYDQREVGYKFHMNDVIATIGLAQLEDLDFIIKRREYLTNLYRSELGKESIKDLKLLKPHPLETYWLFHIISPKIPQIAEACEKAGIETNMVHVRCDIYKVFGGKRQKDLPNMNKIERQYLCLPLHLKLKDDDVRYICKTVKKAIC